MRLVLVVLVVGSVAADDNLRGALEAIQRRQRDLTPVYYSRPYIFGDGQPEDIGYGYQKTIAPNTVGVFESAALPSSELGNHDDSNDRSVEMKALEKLMLDYLEDADNNEVPQYYKRFPVTKKSYFRERDDTDLPETVQRFYNADDLDKQEEETPVFIPSSFRERLSGNRKARLQNAHALVGNVGNLNRFDDKYGDQGDDNEEYLNILNSVWEKYKGEEDPEEITESDMEELLEYLNSKEDRKRQYGGGSHSSGYDFFSSPLVWAKRNLRKDPLELLRLEDDIQRASMSYGNDMYNKNHWQDGAFDDRYPYRGVQKRFPIAKRSLTYYTSTGSSHHNKNTGLPKTDTDTKVAEELNNIFSSDSKTITPKPDASKNESEHSNNHDEPKNGTTSNVGQKESGSGNVLSKPLDVKKKSIDWSDYFGIDRRKKKSMHNGINEDWLYNQYLKSYNLGKDQNDDITNLVDQIVLPLFYDNQNKHHELDIKLRELEDLIVDQAIKYTGAHEGIVDNKEIQEVKNKVMAQLAAALSLEKMRRALGEFRTGIETQKSSGPSSHSLAPPKTEKQEGKTKRIAVKKEKVGISVAEGRVEKKGLKHEMSNMIPDSAKEYERDDFMDCPILQDIEAKCTEIGIIAGDKTETLLPLCTLHQICYLCGPEFGAASPRGCDTVFLSESHTVCRDDPTCYYIARRMLTALRNFKTDISPQGCDSNGQPCIAQYLVAAVRR